MGIFSGLFKSRDNPVNRTPGSSFAFYMGGSSSGKIVNERSAMQMTAVYACVRILSEAIAGLPLHLYRYKEDGGKEKATDHPLYLLLHDEPNPEMSSFVFRETLMTHLLLYGNAYAQIIRNGKGEVVGLYPLMANKMSVNRDTNGQLYTIINGSISGGSSSKIGTWMEYKVVSQSITNNTSTIRFYVFLATLSGSYNVYANNHSGTNRGAMSVTVGGSTVYTREKNGFATGTAVSASNYTTQYSTGYSSASGKPFLTVLTDNASTEAAAYGECTITHNADGTKSVTLAWSGDCSFSSSIGVITGSATISLPTIPRSTTPSVGTLTMGSASTITLNPASSTFTHTLRYAVGSASGTIITKTANTSVSWTPALTLANQVPNATAAVGTLYCDTYSGSTLIGTKSVSITLNVPASVIPSATYTLTDSSSAIATKFSAFIQSKSKVFQPFRVIYRHYRKEGFH